MMYWVVKKQNYSKDGSWAKFGVSGLLTLVVSNFLYIDIAVRYFAKKGVYLTTQFSLQNMLFIFMMIFLLWWFYVFFRMLHSTTAVTLQYWFQSHDYVINALCRNTPESNLSSNSCIVIIFPSGSGQGQDSEQCTNLICCLDHC